MSFFNILELAFAIVIASGVTGAVTLWILKLLGSTISKGLIEKFKSDLQQELESYKTKLKKSEFIFQKEYEAASEFIAMKRGFLPGYRHRDMDWGDACEEMAGDLGKIESQLGAFMSKHGAILATDTLNALTHAEGIAAENKFEGRGPEPSREAIKAMGEIWDELDKIEAKLKDAVLTQSAA